MIVTFLYNVPLLNGHDKTNSRKEYLCKSSCVPHTFSFDSPYSFFYFSCLFFSKLYIELCVTPWWEQWLVWGVFKYSYRLHIGFHVKKNLFKKWTCYQSIKIERLVIKKCKSWVRNWQQQIEFCILLLKFQKSATHIPSF